MPSIFTISEYIDQIKKLPLSEEEGNALHTTLMPLIASSLAEYAQKYTRHSRVFAMLSWLSMGISILFIVADIFFVIGIMLHPQTFFANLGLNDKGKIGLFLLIITIVSSLFVRLTEQEEERLLHSAENFDHTSQKLLHILQKE